MVLVTLRFKVFPGADYKELLHYIYPKMENGFYNTTVLNVWSLAFFYIP